MSSKVAVIEFDNSNSIPMKQALDLVGGIKNLNTKSRHVVIKVGVFHPEAENHTSVGVLNSIVGSFDKAPKIFVTESDNYKGTGSERLQIWKELYSKRVVDFNLSNDLELRKASIASQEMNLSHILFKPNVFVDTHILRSFKDGSILKNLFGCIMDTKRVKYHKILPTLLADVYEAIGGIDLAVIDGTYLWHGAGSDPIQTNTILVGKDAVAVETVGAILTGLNPQEMPVIREFAKRDLGEANIENIKVLGTPLEKIQEKIAALQKNKKKQPSQSGPQTWGGQAHRLLKELTRDGFFKEPQKKTLDEVIKAFQTRGLPTKNKEKNITKALALRVKKGLLKKNKPQNGKAYWTS